MAALYPDPPYETGYLYEKKNKNTTKRFGVLALRLKE